MTDKIPNPMGGSNIAESKDPNQRWKGLIWLNAEIRLLERKGDPASRERLLGLYDELMTLDMALGAAMRAKRRTAKETGNPPPKSAEPDGQG